MTKNAPKLESFFHDDYRSLLGEAAWERLHPDIQKRFNAETVLRNSTYTGIMQEVYLSFAGKILAQFCRIIGTPLALYAGTDVPVKVNVYPDKKLGGMTWDRFYYYQYKPVNRVKSTKCIQYQYGLLEVVGFGFGMYLAITEINGAIQFESTQFFWQLGSLKIPIPHIVTPGKTTVIQQAMPDGYFLFLLNVQHPLLGNVFRQKGIFKEA